jgi:uncharacterized membrane protein YhhN
VPPGPWGTPVFLRPALVCAVAVAVLLIAEARGSAAGRWLSKPIASAAFVWAAAAGGAIHSWYGRLVLAALCLCWLGDVLLIPKGREAWFRAGIGAFLLGHVAFACAFATRPWHAVTFAIGVVLMGLFGWRVWRWLQGRVPAGLAAAVAAYIVTICAMAACAMAAAAGGGPAAIAVGALAFVASDLPVARDRFVAPGFGNVAWGLPVYYAAQLVLAGTV